MQFSPKSSFAAHRSHDGGRSGALPTLEPRWHDHRCIYDGGRNRQCVGALAPLRQTGPGGHRAADLAAGPSRVS